MANTVDKVLKIAEAEIGYLEKASNKNLDSKIDNAGDKNYTKYWRDLCPSMQGQPWCNCFVNWIFTKAYGESEAKKLLCTSGSWSYYTPTSAQYFKNHNQWSSTPKIGSIIYFKNSTRIYHVGIVYKVDSKYVYTYEGNTSSSGVNYVENNGGAVCKKFYSLNYSRIAGYGMPNYEESKKYTIGWHEDDIGWWYADTETSYYKSCWKDINNHRYYFNENGYAVTDWQQINGEWYYFEPRKGHDLECALYVTDKNGVQTPGIF